MEHRRRAAFVFGREHAAAAVVAYQERVDELFVVAEGRGPQLFAGDFVGVQVYGREFVLDDGGVIGEFRLAQTVDAEVLLAVDQREAFGQMLGEEFVDDREGSVVIRVGLLDVGVERVVVDRRAERKGDQLVADVDAAAQHFQLLEVVEGPLHGPLFGAEFRGVSLVRPAPFAFELHALRETVARQILVPEVGVFGHEAVDVVALGLVAASRQVTQVFGVVDVVFQCAVRFECEKSRVHVADHLAALVRQADDAQTLPVGMGVCAQGRDDAREIALADGLHVADLLAAADVEADDQKAVDHGPCAMVHCLPAVHVGECEVAVEDARRHGMALDDLFVFEAYGFEFNHRGCNSCVRYGCNTAGSAPGTTASGCRRRG